MGAYVAGRHDATVRVRTDVAEPEDFPVEVLFREGVGLDAFDREVLTRAAGRVLDVGAGVGALTLPFQAHGREVTALEVLPAAVEILRGRGASDARIGTPAALGVDERFDTAVVLMNGTGLAGTLQGLGVFLEAISSKLAPDGRILIDSTDPEAWPAPPDGRYVGEVHMQLEFDGARGPPAPYLYVSPDRLLACARALGLRGAVRLRADDRFLMELTA